MDWAIELLWSETHLFLLAMGVYPPPFLYNVAILPCVHTLPVYYMDRSWPSVCLPQFGLWYLQMCIHVGWPWSGSLVKIAGMNHTAWEWESLAGYSYLMCVWNCGKNNIVNIPLCATSGPESEHAIMCQNWAESEHAIMCQNWAESEHAIMHQNWESEHTIICLNWARIQNMLLCTRTEPESLHAAMCQNWSRIVTCRGIAQLSGVYVRFSPYCSNFFVPFYVKREKWIIFCAFRNLNLLKD